MAITQRKSPVQDSFIPTRTRQSPDMRESSLKGMVSQDVFVDAVHSDTFSNRSSYLFQLIQKELKTGSVQSAWKALSSELRSPSEIEDVVIHGLSLRPQPKVFGKEQGMDISYASHRLDQEERYILFIDFLGWVMAQSPEDGKALSIAQKKLLQLDANKAAPDLKEMCHKHVQNFGRDYILPGLLSDIIDDVDNGPASVMLRDVTRTYFLKPSADGMVKDTTCISQQALEGYIQVLSELTDDAIQLEGNAAYDAAKQLGVLLEGLRVAGTDLVNDMDLRLEKRMKIAISIANAMTLYGSAGDLLARHGGFFPSIKTSLYDARRIKDLIKLSNKQFGPSLFRRQKEQRRIEFAEKELQALWRSHVNAVRHILKGVDEHSGRQGGNRLWDAFQMGTLLIQSQGF